jgi:hypothetical protein
MVACLYIAKNDAPLHNILFQGGGIAEFTDLEGFQLQFLEPDFVGYGEAQPHMANSVFN